MCDLQLQTVITSSSEIRFRCSWTLSHVRPPPSRGHNFFVKTSFRVFLDTMEIPLSQDFSHVPVEDSGQSCRLGVAG